MRYDDGKTYVNAILQLQVRRDKEKAFEYFKKYGEFSYNGDFKGMMKNAPIVINIGSTYYYVDKLVPLFGSSAIRFEKFERELRDPRSSGKCTLLPPAFIWR